MSQRGHKYVIHYCNKAIDMYMYIYIQTNRKYSILAEINVGPRNKAKILIWLPLTIV